MKAFWEVHLQELAFLLRDERINEKSNYFTFHHVNNSNSLFGFIYKIISRFPKKKFGLQQPSLQQKATKQHVTPILACLNKPPVAFGVEFKIFINNI